MDPVVLGVRRHDFGKIRGYAGIHGLKVIEGPAGLFVGMPDREYVGKDGKKAWARIVECAAAT
jgi:hypothetical protein